MLDSEQGRQVAPTIIPEGAQGKTYCQLRPAARPCIIER
jgi:hypothetical protein